MKQLSIKPHELKLLGSFSNISFAERSSVYQAIEKNGKLYRLKQDKMSLQGNCLTLNLKSSAIYSALYGYYHALNLKLIAEEDIVETNPPVLSYVDAFLQIRHLLKGYKNSQAVLNILNHCFCVDSIQFCDVEDKAYVNVKVYFLQIDKKYIDILLNDAGISYKNNVVYLTA